MIGLMIGVNLTFRRRTAVYCIYDNLRWMAGLIVLDEQIQSRQYTNMARPFHF